MPKSVILSFDRLNEALKEFSLAVANIAKTQKEEAK